MANHRKPHVARRPDPSKRRRNPLAPVRRHLEHAVTAGVAADLALRFVVFEAAHLSAFLLTLVVVGIVGAVVARVGGDS